MHVRLVTKNVHLILGSKINIAIKRCITRNRPWIQRFLFREIPNGFQLRFTQLIYQKIRVYTYMQCDPHSLSLRRISKCIGLIFCGDRKL